VCAKDQVGDCRSKGQCQYGHGVGGKVPKRKTNILCARALQAFIAESNNSMFFGGSQIILVAAHTAKATCRSDSPDKPLMVLSACATSAAHVIVLAKEFM
jgi:hypothetical protein